MTRPTVPAIALLPIRLFFGATFLYAGIDKLLDPSFFDASAPTSIHAQLVAFARISPLGDLVRASLPLAEPIGLVIAIAEIAIGIGALSGLAYRVAAAGGATLSLLFFLTASWATHPFYFGADLPYAVGWITLAVAGHGDLLVWQPIRDAFATMAAAPVRTSAATRRSAAAARRGGRVGYGPGGGRRPGFDRPPEGRSRGTEGIAASPERRLLLQTGLLAGLAALVASFAWPLRAMGMLSEPAPATTGRTPTPGPSAGAASPTGAASPGAGTPPPNGGTVVATLADIQQGGGAASFTVPFNAPAPLPAGDPGIVIQLADGSVVAFDAVCTHAGCTVGWDAQDGVLLCPCHEAAFDPAQSAAVLQGPARRPLASIPVVVDQAAGTISLAS